MDNTAKLLVTGAGGFIGRNLVATLWAQGYKNLLLYDIDSPAEALADYAEKAEFVFHLAGVNRPKDAQEFYTGNAGLTQSLLAALKQAGNKCPVLLSSSTQAGNGTDYAKSKEEAEAAVFEHGKQNESPVFVYRLPGVFGKWSRPSYNSVVATFCHNVARGLPIEVRDPAFMLPLCYIDDVVASFIASMTGDASVPQPKTEENGNSFIGIDPTYELTLGWLAGIIKNFAKSRQSLGIPDMSDGATRKLWATYQSFLPEDGYAYPLNTHADDRGSFTEFLRTHEHGQVSVNVAKPGITKGNHWHNTKNEKFLVVKGSACIRFRPVDGAEITEYTVSGNELQVVDIPPGTTHNITNIGDEELITIMWASDPFDPDSPDTYFMEV